MKKPLFIFLAIILLLTAIYFASRCYLLEISYKSSSGTESVEESKSKGVFIEEFSINPTRFKILENEIKINEVWTEKGWFYKDVCEGTVQISHSILNNMISFEDTDLQLIDNCAGESEYWTFVPLGKINRGAAYRGGTDPLITYDSESWRWNDSEIMQLVVMYKDSLGIEKSRVIQEFRLKLK